MCIYCVVHIYIYMYVIQDLKNPVYSKFGLTLLYFLPMLIFSLIFFANILACLRSETDPLISSPFSFPLHLEKGQARCCRS